MYLEPIFASEDIKVQLPTESKKYGAMERAWKRIMRNAFDCRKVNCEMYKRRCVAASLPFRS